jgi:leader peptidase (prepilin peptidase)/N-methyltransferase
VPWLGDGVAGDVPAWFVRSFAFVMGALWGSFFNVAIYRWPRGMSVVKPGSHCPACGTPVAAYLNLPIVGYLLLRGRARCCGAQLTPRYAWVELLSAVLALALAERCFERQPELGALAALLETCLYFAFVGGLVIATFVDLEWMEIPDEVSLPGAALGLATVGFRSTPGPMNAAIGAGVGFLIVQVLFVWAYELLTGRRGMGEGDAKLLLMIGAFLGWEAVLFCLLAGSVQGLLVAGIAMATGAPMIPTRPDEADLEESPASTLRAAGASARAPETAQEASLAPEAPLDPEAAAVALPGAAGAAGEPLASQASGPAMMVFGPLLAVSALEYLFLGDQVRAMFFLVFGGEP